jgi:type I restriction enzyme S subunit
MEIREGYKQTEIGVIPEDWDVLQIGQLGSFSKGQGIRKDESKSGQLPCVRYGELYTLHNDYIKKFGSFISEEVAKTSKRLKQGDILFAGSGETKEEIGKCAAFIYEIEAYVGGDVIILSPKHGNSLFYGYLFNFPVVARQKANKGQGDAVVHISASSLSSIKVPIPSLSEQQAIATALSDIDGLINSLQKLIDKKKKIKQGTMQELLTGKRRLEGFRGEWEERYLGDITEIISGGTPKTSISEYWNGEIKWCTPTDITGCKTKYLYETEKSITHSGLKNSSATLLPKGALLFCSRATIGEVRIAYDSICTNQGFKSLVVYPGINNEWLYYWVIANKAIFLEKAIGSTFLEISKKDIQVVSIKVPTLPEQTAIANILSDMDSEIEALERKLNKYKDIKQGMMQELLTGRIRLLEEAVP